MWLDESHETILPFFPVYRDTGVLIPVYEDCANAGVSTCDLHEFNTVVPFSLYLDSDVSLFVREGNCLAARDPGHEQGFRV